MRPFIGVDLGTTVTMAASADERGSATVIGDLAGRRGMRSIVAFKNGVPVVGGNAEPTSDGVIRDVKSMLGDPHRRLPLTRWSFPRHEEVTALLLARMKADAERALHTDVTQAVLTVPATFDFTARRAVRDAGTIAGLEVRHLLTERTAAALAYRGRLPAGCTVLVFGLGGGVFDASLVQVSADCLAVRATTGDRRLGGWDWDNLLMRLVQDRLTAAGGPDLLTDDGTEAQFRSRAQAAKHRLSYARHTEVRLKHGATAWRIPVSRADFEAVADRPLARAEALVDHLLTAGAVRASEIDRVLLVGGSTRMPAVPRMLRRLLGLPLERSVVPEDAVALGAALYDPAFGIQELASHGLGILARSARTGALRNVMVIQPEVTLPATGSVVLSTAGDVEERLVLDVTVGDGTDPTTVRIVHREVVTVRKEHSSMGIEVRCRYDGAEMPRVEVREVAGNRLLSGFAVHSRGAMSEVDLDDAADRLANPVAP